MSDSALPATLAPVPVRERLVLAGDGALITGAALASVIAVALLVAWGVGDREVPVALQLLNGPLSLAAAIGGPIAAWLLHRRRITPPAVLGALLAGPVVGIVFGLFVASSTLLGWVLRPLSDADYIGPLVAGIVVAAAFAVFMGWLGVSTIGDLRDERPGRRRLELVRLVALGIVVAYSVTIVVLAVVGPTAEIGEAIAFMLVGAISGGLAVLMADLMSHWLAPRPAGSGAAPA